MLLLHEINRLAVNVITIITNFFIVLLSLVIRYFAQKNESRVIASFNPKLLCLNILLALYYITKPNAIVSHLYVVFHLNAVGRKVLLPEFLLLFFKRDEFLRLVTYLNYGSQRPEFNFNDMSEIKIPLPTIEKQREMVAVWTGLREMKEENRRIAEPLESLCRSYLQDLKYKYPLIPIGSYIEPCDERNSNLMYSVDNVRGISINKSIIDTKADMNGVSLTPYKLFKSNQFCFVTVTSRNGEKITIAINDSKSIYMVSSSYCVFKVRDDKELLSDYLFLFFCIMSFLQ